MNTTEHFLVLAAIRHGVYIMQNVDADDRDDTANELVESVKVMMRDANRNSGTARQLLLKAIPAEEWVAMQR